MRLNSAELGELYEDKSGWAKRLMLDYRQNTLEIEVESQVLQIKATDLDWLIEGLQELKEMTGD